MLDPYDVHELTPEEYQVGRLVFVRSPESGDWVSLYDSAGRKRARSPEERMTNILGVAKTIEEKTP